MKLNCVRETPAGRRRGWFARFAALPVNALLLLSAGAVFAVVGIATVWLVNYHMRQQALAEAEAKAQLLLDRNLATHTYFTHRLKPAVFPLVPPEQEGAYFDPAWMSSTYAIRQIESYFDSLNATEYYYKECAVNARSPENEADAFERGFIEEMNARPELTVRAQIRTLEGKPYFTYLRRGEVMEESCLRCHSTPEWAPAGLVEKYGSERSFHRQKGEAVSAISIRVPLDAAFGHADRFSWQLSGLLLILLCGLFAALFAVNRVLLLRPLDRIRQQARQIAGSRTHLGRQIPLPSGRELGELTADFNRMSAELRASHDELEQRVAERTAELECLNLRLREDMTEREQTARDLVRLERLRAVGELSAGVSHNLNNILTTVLGPAQLLKRKTDDPQLLREVDDIVSSAERARDLVHRLHLSVRGEEEDELGPVFVDRIVEETVRVTRPRWKDQPESRGIRIEVVTDLGGVPPVRGTESRFHDILTNLIFNAVDAMPEGGTIRIRTEEIDGMVQLTCRDTGTGMDEATRRRVFEPFFTTKADIGTGLGLSTAHNAATQWGGDIDVESAPGEGTLFALRLPVWKEEKIRETGPAEAPRGRRGKLLVVDDDEGVRRLLARLLAEHHEVHTAGDGREALEKFASGGYDAVLIDLGIPDMPGDRLLRELRRIDPAVPAVLITGWELGDTDPRQTAFDFQLRKPFDDLDRIGDIVARAIEARDRRTDPGGPPAES